MKKPLQSCPVHAGSDKPASVNHPVGSWPPGPDAGLTGWGLLSQMSSDLMGTLEAWQREFGDLVHVRTWPEHQVIVSDPQLARELLVNQADSLQRWERALAVYRRVHGHSVLIAEGQAWRGKRQTLQPDFTRKSVQAFSPSILEAGRQAFDHWPRDEASWPIESALTSLTMEVIIRMMFSSGMGEDAAQAEKAVHTLMVASTDELWRPASLPDWMPWQWERRRARLLLNALIERHLQARLAQSPDDWPEDLLSRLLCLHRQQPQDWPLQAIRDECKTAFLAGHETVAASLVWWAWCMASYPAAQEKARTEAAAAWPGEEDGMVDMTALRYVSQTLQESMRLYPAVPLLMSRRAIQPVSLGGWTFPVRTVFMVPMQLMQKDARWFPEPLAYRPERFDPQADKAPQGAYLPFGGGPRVCLGQHLAMTEMTLLAAQLLRRYRLALPDGAPPPRPVFHVSQRPKLPLALRIERI
ncbi:cytochrome P450 [Chromobacterium alticapitis]|uniref:Cytochrome P450 n=1 Tax=Chromobacterium alticapitis TaxID=2073169 RepID=A0A2S5DD11_9NEIS|nr:cytochrome P450 [Chromobacterium alticapitis]POZ60985.1 cytochrome P450 [Chromobacterium alticapitis]